MTVPAAVTAEEEKTVLKKKTKQHRKGCNYWND